MLVIIIFYPFNYFIYVFEIFMLKKWTYQMGSKEYYVASATPFLLVSPIPVAHCPLFHSNCSAQKWCIIGRHFYIYTVTKLNDHMPQIRLYIFYNNIRTRSLLKYKKRCTRERDNRNIRLRRKNLFHYSEWSLYIEITLSSM